MKKTKAPNKMAPPPGQGMAPPHSTLFNPNRMAPQQQPPISGKQQVPAKQKGPKK